MTSKIVNCCLVLVLLAVAHSAEAKQKKKNSEVPSDVVIATTTPQSPLKDVESKQFFADPQSRETDPPNFVRLLVMRLIYGLAVQMGFEDRLSGILNGVFVPPNADDDDYGGFDADFGDALGDGGDGLLDF